MIPAPLCLSSSFRPPTKFSIEIVTPKNWSNLAAQVIKPRSKPAFGFPILMAQEQIMADATPQEFPTVIGTDASFKGELTFEKGMRLMGKFEGRITTAGRLHIAKEARMQADVESGAIIVEGEVKGNLTASDRIELKQSARLEGDLRATKMTVEDGAVFSGH